MCNGQPRKAAIAAAFLHIGVVIDLKLQNDMWRKLMQAIKQYTEVINGSIHIDLPKDFTAKLVKTSYRRWWRYR